MVQDFELDVNDKKQRIAVDPETPLLYVLRNDLGLKGPKFGCGLEQCNACKVLVDGNDVPSCRLPVKQVEGLKITTVEGMGTAAALHPLQEAFIEEQAIQCGYCASGLIIAAQGLLNRNRYPTDDDIREALSDNICRCGVYERVRRAIKMRIGQPHWEPIYEVIKDTIAIDEPAERPATATLPVSLSQTPSLDAWIRINADETVTIFTGKVEYGQGINTALAQIASEELDVAVGRIRLAPVDTTNSPNEGPTFSSMSLELSGNAIRQAAAEARSRLLNLAFEELETHTPADALIVEDGTIVDPQTGRKITYWRLFGDKRFGGDISGRAQPKAPSYHNVVGEPVTRLDLAAKVSGEASFVHDIELPGMVHGRVIRPPGPAARLISFDDSALKKLAGAVKIIRDGSFLAVIAEREEQAIWAHDTLKEACVWENSPGLPAGYDELFKDLMAPTEHNFEIVGGKATGTPPSDAQATDDLPAALSATFFRPFQMHGSLSPSAAVAHLDDGFLTIWSHSQGIHILRDTIAQVVKMNVDDIRIVHAEGSGCYGHNGAEDAALDAALLALAMPGRPVSLKWNREDEHSWEPYGPAMVIKMTAGLDTVGAVSGWTHEVWSFPHSGRPQPNDETSGFPVAQYLEQPFARQLPRVIQGYHYGEYRNADPKYSFPGRRIVSHLARQSPLRTSSLRSLGTFANIFAIESFLDECAHRSGHDPVAYRLMQLEDERARAVIRAAAEKAGWEPRPRPALDGRGRGIAFAQYKNMQCYAAIVVELEVDLNNGRIQLKRAVIAADAGQIVNPDGLSNQLEGGFVQSASWTLHEQVTFDGHGVTSRDWESYPILRFSGVPEIKTVLLSRPQDPFLGSGEATQGPTPAAIANALFDATGVRIRDLPLTADKIHTALRER